MAEALYSCVIAASGDHGLEGVNLARGCGRTVYAQCLGRSRTLGSGEFAVSVQAWAGQMRAILLGRARDAMKRSGRGGIHGEARGVWG